MSVNVETSSHDFLSIELVVEEQDDQMWVLMAHLADFLMRRYGVPLDADKVVVTLVYGGGEDGR